MLWKKVRLSFIKDSGSDLEFTLNRPALISLLTYLVNKEQSFKITKKFEKNRIKS